MNIILNIILISVALFLLLVWARKPWIFNVAMLWGAGLGFIIIHAEFQLVDTFWHKGPGIIVSQNDETGEELADKVSERQYKRKNYGEGGMMLLFGAFGWVAVADWARKNYKKTLPPESE